MKIRLVLALAAFGLCATPAAAEEVRLSAHMSGMA